MDTLLARREHNAALPINQLPDDVLCKIFSIGDADQRNLRRYGLPYIGFQDFIIQVCHRWRQSALDKPDFWNYIFVSHKSQNAYLERAQTYLRRAGYSVPLHIDLELEDPGMSGYIDPYTREDRLTDARKILVRLMAFGAPMPRWKSLIASSRCPEILFELIELIKVGYAPELCFVSLEWNHKHIYCAEDYEARLRVRRQIAQDPAYSLFPDVLRRPQLRRVDLEQFPAGYLFARQASAVSHLTHLKLTTALEKYSVTGLQIMLAANPQLESLALHNRESVLDKAESESKLCSVHLPCLRSFTVGAILNSLWGILILKMVNAPGVETFEYIGASDGLYRKVVHYVTHGITHEETWENIKNLRVFAKKPIYPALRMLKVGGFCCTDSDIDQLLCDCPEIVSLDIGGQNIKVLSYVPRRLPKLRHLRVRGPCSGDLSAILDQRRKSGLILGEVEVTPENDRPVEDVVSQNVWIQNHLDRSYLHQPPEAELAPVNTEIHDELVAAAHDEPQSPLERVRTPGSDWSDLSDDDSSWVGSLASSNTYSW
ncbi:hypothetical protein FRC12_016885 [Ceratobasidium sp. 428]|nr:hypothetical protein FRC12_016885 [Ceratobasidium sp. 428]